MEGHHRPKIRHHRPASADFAVIDYHAPMNFRCIKQTLPGTAGVSHG
jgi:hypothetical protein